MNTNTTEKQETMKTTRRIMTQEGFNLEFESELQAAVQKARTEVAEEILTGLERFMNIDSFGRDKLEDLKAKYLPPTTEKCHCLEALSGGKHHEHCMEKSKEPK